MDGWLAVAVAGTLSAAGAVNYNSLLKVSAENGGTPGRLAATVCGCN